MLLTIVIILIVVLVILAILVNAFQQHREKIEAEKRTEIAKQKSVIDDTEDVLMASSEIPISPQLIGIMHTRIKNALRIIYELNPSTPEIRQRLRDAEDKEKSYSTDAPAPSQDNFTLPDNDKLIIQCIQAIKKLRILLRSEHSKGKVDTQSFMTEDKRLGKLQLRVNVDTLTRRGQGALKTNMLGSARQYFEKAMAALNSQTEVDEFITQRKAILQNQLNQIQDSLRNANASDRARRSDAERNELDELFAPKKKW